MHQLHTSAQSRTTQGAGKGSFALAVTVGVLFLSTSVQADHMNGRYYGTDEWSNYQLTLSQNNYQVSGQILECGGTVVRLNGQSDGGDNAQGTAEAQNGFGEFYLYWQSNNVALDLLMGGTRYNVNFSHQQQPNDCGDNGFPDGDQQHSDEQDDAHHSDEDHSHEDDTNHDDSSGDQGDHQDDTDHQEDQGDQQDDEGSNEEDSGSGGPLPTF